MTDKKATRMMSKVTLRKGYLDVIGRLGIDMTVTTLNEFDEILKDEIVEEQMGK